MTVTVASFRASFPAFASTADFPDPQVQFWLAFAPLRHNVDRWGSMLDMGIMLFMAHYLSLDFNARKSQQAGQGAGAVVGVLTSVTADKVSWTREAPATNPSDDHWALTIYGKQWKEMTRLVGAGGVYVGIPNEDEMRGGGMAWPGPYPGVW